MRQADRKPTVYKFAAKARKQDAAKGNVLQEFVAVAETFADGGNVEITNLEREFLFTYNGRRFKVVLSCPRS